jgi:hypothetical protein
LPLPKNKIVLASPLQGNGHEVPAVIQSSCAEAGEGRVGTTDGVRKQLLHLPYNLA